jgi:lipopolysaccharide/colanic/teichoic acid biosynthesis glycosyltransferase
MAKRLFDIIFSFIGLLILSPALLIAAALIKSGSKGPVFYRGLRAGKDGKSFRIFKFRTMVPEAEKIGGPSTSADDDRLTRFGKFLRKRNLDEFPQLINVLKGEMSFVGPRPEVISEIETYKEEERKAILSVKPGITDFASLSNVHEEEILKGSADPHQAYREKIKPEKIRLGMKYVKERSFWLDIKIIIKTVLTALR